MIVSMQFNTYEIRGILIALGVVVVLFGGFSLYKNGYFERGVDLGSKSHDVEIIRLSPEEGQDIQSLASALVKGSTGNGRINTLIVQDVVVGAGAEASEGNVVEVSYIGVLENGRIIDQTEEGETFAFTLGGGDVIEGWDLGILGMRVGGERILVIPSSLAYKNVATEIIPKNSTLLFSVTLHSVE